MNTEKDYSNSPDPIEKIIKVAGYTAATVAGLVALGFLFKALTFTVSNYKGLRNTIKS